MNKATSSVRSCASGRRQGWLSDIDQKRILCCMQNMRMICNSTFLFDKETHHSPKLAGVSRDHPGTGHRRRPQSGGIQRI